MRSLTIVMGTVFAGLGLLFIIAGAFDVFDVIQGKGPVWVPLVIGGGFLLIGVEAILQGIFSVGEPNFYRLPVTFRRWKLGKLQTINIDRGRVRVTERGLFAADWEEPLSTFIGVLRRTHQETWAVASYRAGTKGTVYPVELVHPDRSKTLELYSGRGKETSHKVWRDAAHVLDLPARDETT